jgi:dTDP-4-amino-4,6-dideoxygalactose transaminase
MSEASRARTARTARESSRRDISVTARATATEWYASSLAGLNADTAYHENGARHRLTRVAAVREHVVVPFVDLGPTHAPIKAALVAEFSALLDSGTFTNGPAVARFEEAFAACCGRTFGVGVSSGLDALRLALLAGGIEAGDEVILPAHTFVATAEAATQAGGKPVLVDSADVDYCIDPAAVEDAVTARTRFVLPVHLYGQLADMAQLCAVADRHGLDIVEDACQAHGAARDGRQAGGSGRAGAFSFFPAKNLGALGDAGACVTDDPELAEGVRALREHGQRSKGAHSLVGYTARLDTIQAGVLLHKLPLLDQWNDQRRSAARFYSSALSGVGDLRLPPVPAGSDPVWHVFVVRTAQPDALAKFLRERGIASGRHYPTPVHLTAAYAHLGYRRGAFPVAEALADEGLSLPIFPGISARQLEAVVTGVSDYFGARTGL